ncbi:MAG: hypothetical protein H6Q10_1414 [Acidobacteria bacterium]|nr:hypothetical protein [Acidobacteriota bacterium]
MTGEDRAHRAGRAARWTDERLEGLLGTVLRWGVIGAASVVALGAVVFLARGLLLLIATPVTRVVFSIGVFALQKDLRYVLITAIVLAVLLYSLFGPYL